MKLVSLDRMSLPEWASFLPEETFVEMLCENREMYAIGVEFEDQPVGAVCWEETPSEWSLQSIYVTPDARRLGLGYELLAELIRRMREKGAQSLYAAYEPTSDRATLTPFLINVGFLTDTLELPLGKTTLGNAADALRQHGADQKTVSYQTLSQLGRRDRFFCDKWLMEQTGEHLSHYIGGTIDSLVIMDKNEIQAILLLSEEHSTIRLEYCWIDRDHMYVFLPLLYAAIERLSVRYPKETGLEMLLSNDQVTQLYTRLLGTEMSQAYLCSAHFSASEPLLPHVYEISA